ncbi:MAG: cob(I)yrinic acid a,c-diamide adenosyltransferase [Methylococcus sp.]|nr:MAG: cob(I)yrinic acid a,c-diamide adenosyltransferase [Methylococcus sp.]
MGHRLTRIYTRTGDDGTTGLADGSRIEKDAPRIALMGELDELNSRLGLVLTEAVPNDLARCFEEIQQLLFDLGGDLSIQGRSTIKEHHVLWLEAWLDHFNDRLDPLKEFILPGGTRAAAYGHLARTCCRQAERVAVSLNRIEPLPAYGLEFLNRLSDFLFVACRILGESDDAPPHHWDPARAPLLPPRD